MNQDDIEKILGPGVPVSPDDVWLSRLWKCAQCDTMYESAVPAEMPVPCANCGGVFFERLGAHD